jgi:arylsulfatase A-like enzyme
MVLLAASAALPAVAGSQQARPNILIIVTDDQRASNTLGVMPKTLRLFRRGGKEFTSAFATTPLCCPSRASILTGRYAHNTGVRQNNGLQGLDLTTLFPRLLVRDGYRTALAGKFLNGWRRTRLPYFDRWAVLRDGLSRYVRPTFNINGSWRRTPGYSTDLIGEHAIRFLRRFENQDAAPWFLYVATSAPHFPWTPARRHARAPLSHWRGNPAILERNRSDKPAYVRRQEWTLADARAVRAGQLRTLMSVDDMVGRIFRNLDVLGEKRNTLAVFTSDNGLVWADHSVGDGSSAGAKRVPYTASIRVPFFVRWPGRVRAGSRDGRIVGNVDIAPTVLAAARIEPDPARPPMDGRSLLGSGRRARMLFEHWKSKGNPVPTWASLRTRRYQYVEYYRSDGRRFFREYYKLARDRWQLRNLLGDATAANDPDVRRLQARLARDRRCAGRGASPRPCP